LYKVIGLGAAGCAIAEEFTAYPEYRVFKIDSDIKERASLSIGKHGDMESYEKNLSKDEIEIYLRSIKKGDEVLFILEGGEPISGASLSILETVRDAKITVMYILPDRDLCSLLQKRDDRISFYVFQEYARSGLFENLFLVDKPTVEGLIGDVPIQDHAKQVAYFIAYIFAMINYFNHTEPILCSPIKGDNICRISSVGICSLQSDTSMLFPLQSIKDCVFYYGIPEQELSENTTLMREIKTHVKDKNPGDSATFSIFSTTFEKTLILSIASSRDIQKLPKEF
tara:strand:+ start:221 stop:1069 length:849 start_codon:yes stop_codon:yes gene_type:complete